VSFAAITICVASQRVFIVAVVYFVIDSVRKFLDISSYVARMREMKNAHKISVETQRKETT
jgi:uncharacterized protein YqjF (DUF2071 family)